MDPLAIDDRDLFEALLSHRGSSDGSNDPRLSNLAASILEDEELHAIFKRLQRADDSIQAAFADVPVPADLAGRVLLCLSEAASAKPVVPVNAVPIQIA